MVHERTGLGLTVHGEAVHCRDAASALPEYSGTSARNSLEAKQSPGARRPDLCIAQKSHP
jgi:hypothetical protein